MPSLVLFLSVALSTTAIICFICVITQFTDGIPLALFTGLIFQILVTIGINGQLEELYKNSLTKQEEVLTYNISKIKENFVDIGEIKNELWIGTKNGTTDNYVFLVKEEGNTNLEKTAFKGVDVKEIPLTHEEKSPYIVLVRCIPNETEKSKKYRKFLPKSFIENTLEEKTTYELKEIHYSIPEKD